MYKNAYEPIDIVECDYCSRTLKGNAVAAGRAEWDWFTGKTNKTKHACNNCKNKPIWKSDLKEMKTQLGIPT